MANFMNDAAPDGSRWKDFCSKESPKVGTDGLLTGRWRDAIVAAVAVEKAGGSRRYADGPAGQVIDYLCHKGFGKFRQNADATEQAAHAGRLRPPTSGHPSSGGYPDTRPVCPYGTGCYRKNPIHFQEYAHPWKEGGGGGGFEPGRPVCPVAAPQGGGKGGGKGGGGAFEPGRPVAAAGAGAPSPAAAAPLQVRCGKCGHVNSVSFPPGSPSGARVRVTCPKCKCVNEVQLPQHGAGGHHGSRPSAIKPPWQAPSVGGRPPRPTGRRRALLVGVNYPGTRAELRGCINDVHNLNRLLVESYGWNPRDIRTLTDDGRGTHGMPTRRNIETQLTWLAQGAAPGDVLWFSFSGHGAQQEDPHGYEEDGMNETILPVDFESAGMMTDDQLGDLIVKPLPEGVRLTSVMDCCHSGTGLDLPFTWDQRRGSWREETNPYHSMGDVLMFSGCEDDDTSSDASSMYGAAGGAMTTALCDVLRRNPNPSYPQLLDMLHQHLRRGGFSQRPVLTSSQQFHFDRPFSLDDIHPNNNPQLGRTFRKRFPPQPKPMFGPLADMLGPLGMLAGGMILGHALGGVAEAAFSGGVGDAVGGMLGGLGGMAGGLGGGLMGGGLMDAVGGFFGGDDDW